MAESSLNGLKTLWEKEKLLVTSNFSFSHCVFITLVLPTRKNQGLFGKGLNIYWAIHHLNPLPDNKFLDFSKLKEFADDNFKFDENGRKLSKWVENTGGKGEIARYKQFLLFPQCFQKACFPGASKGVIVWEWVNSLPNNKLVDWSNLKAFAEDKVCVTKTLKFVLGRVENILGNEENAGFQHFLLFPECFQKSLSSGLLKVGLVW